MPTDGLNSKNIGAIVETTKITLTTEDLAEAIMIAMREHRSVNAATHKDHHEFVELLMAREARRVDRVKKFNASFIGAIAVLVVTLLGWVGMLVISAFQHGGR